jgi:hypothetical protein
MSKYSKKAQEAISHKMHIMKGEKKPQAQKVAISLSIAREKGLKVPSEKKNKEKLGSPYGMHDLEKTMERGSEAIPSLPEPKGHTPKELKSRLHEFLKHPQIK